MKKVSLILLLVSYAYGSMQQMVVADAANNNNVPPINVAKNTTNNNSNDSILALAAQAKDDLPPELKSSLLRDLNQKHDTADVKHENHSIISPLSNIEGGPSYNTPHVSNSAVLAWSNEAIVSTFSYDFMNIERSRQVTSNYYTPRGWRIMTEVHHEIGDEAVVTKEQLVASAVAIATPKIIEQKIIENNYSWLIEIPLLLTLTKTGHVKSSKVLTRFLVIRDNPQVHDRGLAINNISLKKIAQ
mgnify:CR=1 FL=1